MRILEALTRRENGEKLIKKAREFFEIGDCVKIYNKNIVVDNITSDGFNVIINSGEDRILIHTKKNGWSF